VALSVFTRGEIRHCGAASHHHLKSVPAALPPLFANPASEALAVCCPVPFGKSPHFFIETDEGS